MFLLKAASNFNWLRYLAKLTDVTLWIITK